MLLRGLAFGVFASIAFPEPVSPQNRPQKGMADSGHITMLLRGLAFGVILAVLQTAHQTAHKTDCQKQRQNGHFLHKFLRFESLVGGSSETMKALG